MHKYLIAVDLDWLPKWQDRCCRASRCLYVHFVQPTVLSRCNVLPLCSSLYVQMEMWRCCWCCWS